MIDFLQGFGGLELRFSYLCNEGLLVAEHLLNLVLSSFKRQCALYLNATRGIKGHV